MNKYYILIGKIPVPVSFDRWIKSFDQENRVVRSLKIGKFHISTVFLGLDHAWNGRSPLLFETMIFGGHIDSEYQTRCSTYKQAVRGHYRAIGYLIGSLIKLKLNIS